MTQSTAPGLGELLRHLIDLLDRGSEDHYRAELIDYKARYTPFMRALGNGPRTVAELQEEICVTQGAISQTVKLMEADGLARRHSTKDGRSRIVALTEDGQALHCILVEHWQLRFSAIEALENEIEAPLRHILVAAIAALRREGFAERLEHTRPARFGSSVRLSADG